MRNGWIAGLLLGVSPLLGAQVPEDAAPEQRAAAAAHHAYSERIAPRLAESGQPRALAFAALLRETGLRHGSDAAAPPADARAREWREMAFARAGSDLAALTLLLAGTDDEDPIRAKALARWRQLEPANLAPLLRDAEASPRQVLEAARTATRMDTHAYAQLRAMLDGYRSHPPTAEEADRLLGDADGRSGTLDAYAAIHGMGLLAAAMPNLQPLLEFCRDTATAAPTSIQADDCRNAGALLMAGDTHLVRMLGFALAEEMVRDDDTYHVLNAARRRFDWQMLQWGRLSASAPGGGIDDFVRLLRDPAIGDEPGLVERLLREAGIPLDPPAGWQPPRRD
ncbi:hypothetical protein [Luteimonas suaedae]|uniref:hypothetical protein n=1 Tax=Luteimonas suaedae TaxID=2605430 RepID=UPI0011EFF3D5|nr:hypothetical protein [Luteimonas suaedae]